MSYDVSTLRFEDQRHWRHFWRRMFLKQRQATSGTINSPLKILDMEIDFSSQIMMSHDILCIQLWVLKTDVADVIFKEEH